ncbi:ATP-dependent nuclease [Flavobacterium sp. HTF]|uniref:ATP-dependent nuclease n=1 Tax=Flavobacterium sp. HTF TaxID=2170732 RepID=UPI000D5C916F|nr:AAA family ATPase [Flavobacterium sp. HTF]PWB26251.1 ATP-binding protein [Flavobacterium sp. HTF]
MKTEFWLDSIEFKNGLNVNLKKDSIVVFVGPNNSGKSQTLREISHLTKGPKINNIILESLKISASGNAEVFLERIKSRLKNGVYMYYESTTNSGLNGDSLKDNWNYLLRGTQGSSVGISNFLVKSMNTTSRLSLVSPPDNIDFMNEMRTHSIHVLKEDSEKELQFSKYFKEAFGEEVIINHGAGRKIPLHVGERPKSTAENDRVSTEYQKKLRELPLLHEQGDGMKSFAGVFLSLFAEDFSVNIIDEPEAFLHPPQASLLGQMVSQKLGDQKQLFIATHSEHFLKGLLENATDRLIVIRIERSKSTNSVKVLKNSDLQSIWKDSILRHSNILDGLFHKRVVLVESDSDCRFYSAISSAIIDNEKISSPDILFIQSGGKHRFPVIIKALKELEVPLTIIGDFDFYHDENPTKFVYESLGGDWNNIKSDFLKVKKAIDEKRPELETDKLKEEIDLVFSSFSDKIIPEQKIKDIQSLLKRSSPWSQAKASGKAYLPAGDITASFNKVQSAFKEKNLHILELGEIEAFDKSIGGHGPKWVNKVLEKDLLSSEELEEARKFVNNTILK